MYTAKSNPDWRDMTQDCTQAVMDQVKAELNASMTYMAMGAHFSRVDFNRPGFAKLFFDSANEEREHAMHLISYLLKRGELSADDSYSAVSKLIDFTTVS